MSIPEKYHHAQQTAAAQAVNELRYLARKGDAQAISAIRDIALRAIGVLDSLTCVPPGHPETPESIRKGVDTAHEVAKKSIRWPVALDAVHEIRKDTLGRWERLEVGTNIGIRLKGKGRGFDYAQLVGFALDVFQELDAIRRNPANHFHPADIHPELAVPGVLTDSDLRRSWRNLAACLEPLSKESLTLWADAGRELCREWCEGDWMGFGFPSIITCKADRVTDENGHVRDAASAIRGKIYEGLDALIPK